MHQDIKYEGTDLEKRTAALRDLRNWFGEARWKELNTPDMIAEMRFASF